MGVPKNMLGTYRFVDRAENSDKIWKIKKLANNVFEVQFGRRLAGLQSSMIYSESQALSRIKAKVRKGYEKITSIPKHSVRKARRVK